MITLTMASILLASVYSQIPRLGLPRLADESLPIETANRAAEAAIRQSAAPAPPKLLKKKRSRPPIHRKKWSLGR